MATITLKGNQIHTSGQLPAKGSQAPDFKLVRTDLSEVSLASYPGKRKILNIFPSIDTAVCAASVRNSIKMRHLLKIQPYSIFLPICHLHRSVFVRLRVSRTQTHFRHFVAHLQTTMA